MVLELIYNWKKIIPAIIALIVFLMVWYLLIYIFTISPLILPTPYEVAASLFTNLPFLLQHGGLTLLEAVLGFLLGGVAAVVLAVVFQFSDKFQEAIYPYVIALKAIPLVVLAPLVVVWFGSGFASKVVMASIISFFPIMVNAVQGLNSVEQEALDLMASLSASRRQVLLKLKFPASLVAIFAGMKISSTFAVIGAVVAELVNAQNGIGYVIKNSSYYLDTALTFAAIFVAALIGLLFFWVINILEKKIIFWKQNTEDYSSIIN
jgi:NitT/TauT family transport system permease protein